MFINNKYTVTRTLSLIASLAIAFTSCVQLGEEQDAAYGYLTIGGFDVDVQVGQLVPTKADGTVNISGVTGYSAPSLSSVTVTSVEDNSKTYEWSGTVLKLPVGNYTLAATSGSNAFDAPYFTGEGTVEVISGQEVTGKVTFTLANSVMKVTLAEGFDQHFIPEGETPVTISGTSESVSVAMDTYVFVPSDEQLTVKIDGKSSAEIERDYTVDVTPSAATAYDVVLSTGGAALPTIELSKDQLAWGNRIFITAPAGFTGNISEGNKAKLVYEAIEATSPDWNNPKTASGGVIKGLEAGTVYKVRARVGNLTSNEISLKPLVSGLESSAAHTKTGNDLDGTDVTTTFTSPAQVVTDAISGWTFQLYKSDETEPLREYTDTDGSVTSDGSLITDIKGWPYLPQGTYRLKATATLNDNDNSTVSSMTDIKVGAPEFSVSVSGKTSYSYYTSQGAAVANTKDAETIHEVSSNITIADNILGNSNYSKPTVTYEVDGKTVSGTYSASKTHNHQGGISGLSWNSHTLKATVTFDGKESVGECPCVITGLPYSYNFVNGSLDKYRADGWTTNGDLSVSNMSLAGRPTTLVLQRQDSEGFIVSPRFNITSDISVQASILRSSYFLYWGGSRSRTGYVGAVSNTSTSNTTSRTYSCEGGSSTGGTVYGSDEWLDAFVISMSSPYISIDSDSRVKPSTASYYFLHAAHFRYAE